MPTRLTVITQHSPTPNLASFLACLSCFCLWACAALQPPATIPNPSYGPNLLDNPSFESPDVSPDSIPFRIMQAGQRMGAWTISGQSVDLNSEKAGIAAQGRQFIDLTGSPGIGSIRQTIATAPGKRYEIRFALAGNTGNVPEYPSPLVKQLEVRWNSAVVDAPKVDVSLLPPNSINWDYRRYIVEAASASTTIEFVSLTPGATGPMIDDVSVREIIDPAKPVLAAGGNANSGNIVLNGGFETPALTPNTFATYNSGANVGAWTISGGGVDLTGTGFMATAEGNQALDLNGSPPGTSPGNGTITQTLVTRPGQQYTLRFAVAGNSDSPQNPLQPSPAKKATQVIWNGATIDTPTFDSTGHTRVSPGWTYHSYAVTATSSSTVLQFSSTILGGYGPMLDDISVKAVPHP